MIHQDPETNAARRHWAEGCTPTIASEGSAMANKDDEQRKTIPCPNCSGTGRVKEDNLNPYGICPWCKGSGKG